MQMQQNSPFGKRRRRRDDDHEERGLVPAVHGPEVAEEASLRGLLLRHMFVRTRRSAIDRNVIAGRSAINRRRIRAFLDDWLVFRSNEIIEPSSRLAGLRRSSSAVARTSRLRADGHWGRSTAQDAAANPGPVLSRQREHELTASQEEQPQ